MKRVNIKKMKGCKILNITQDTTSGALLEVETDKGIFYFDHIQECSELVWLEDGYNDLKNMIGEEILRAEVSYNKEDELEDCICSDLSFTWTFYKISTFNYDTTLRFYGTSNGYYSEDVELFFKEV